MGGRDGRHPSPAVEATRRPPPAAHAPPRRSPVGAHSYGWVGDARRWGAHRLGRQNPPVEGGGRSGTSGTPATATRRGVQLGNPGLVSPPPPPQARAPRRHPPAVSAPSRWDVGVARLSTRACARGRARRGAPARRRGPLTTPWTPTARACWRAQRPRGCVTKKAGARPGPRPLVHHTRHAPVSRQVGGGPWRVSALRALPPLSRQRTAGVLGRRDRGGRQRRRPWIGCVGWYSRDPRHTAQPARSAAAPCVAWPAAVPRGAAGAPPSLGLRRGRVGTGAAALVVGLPGGDGRRWWSCRPVADATRHPPYPAAAASHRCSSPPLPPQFCAHPRCHPARPPFSSPWNIGNRTPLSHHPPPPRPTPHPQPPPGVW